MNDIVYVLTNEAMPGYVKIGHTKDLNRRLKDLYKTAVPLPFEVFYACTVKNGRMVEDWLFKVFKKNRVNPDREFFELSPDSAETALREKAIKNVTPKDVYVESKEDRVALNKARKNRDRFNFKMVDIPVGAELIFSKDKNVKAKVVDNRHIEFRGEVTSLGVAADSILSYKHKVAGTLYWKYKNETLDERRRRMERGI